MAMLHGAALEALLLKLIVAVLQYVERELLNHNRLLHPHIVQFREVRDAGMPGQHHCFAGMCGRSSRKLDVPKVLCIHA